MIPGWTITKDPKVTVKVGSEKCYVFVKVTKSTNFDKFMSYDIADDWTQLVDKDQNNVPGVYFRIVDASAADSDMEFPVLVDNKVQVSKDVTKEMMNDLNKPGASLPTLTFQAAAIQYEKTNGTAFDAINAYNAINWDAAAATGSTN